LSIITVIQHLTLEIRQYDDVIFKIQSILKLKFAYALYALESWERGSRNFADLILKLSFTVI